MFLTTLFGSIGKQMKTDKVEQSVFQKGAKVTPGGRCISARTREKFDVLLESSKKHYYDDYLSSDALKSPTNREGQSAFGFADA